MKCLPPFKLATPITAQNFFLKTKDVNFATLRHLFVSGLTLCFLSDFTQSQIKMFRVS